MELNSNQIREIIPHRYPMQLVDKIIDFEPGQWAEGIKYSVARLLYSHQMSLRARLHILVESRMPDSADRLSPEMF